jgi:hypothetical protein
MALRELQTALGTIIATHAADLSRRAAQRAWLGTLDLTEAERTWLKQLLNTPGMRLTCTIQRWWRQMRLQQTVRLTLAALPAARRLQVVPAYIAAVPCTSLFFIPEARQFLDFVLHTVTGVPHLDAIARFEHALWCAREAEDTSVCTPPDITALSPSRVLHRHQAAALISFSAPPEQLLHALLQGLPVPAPDNRAYAVLVAPRLPHYWRPVTPDEAHLFTACHAPTTVERLRTTVEHPSRPLQALIDASALCIAP